MVMPNLTEAEANRKRLEALRATEAEANRKRLEALRAKEQAINNGHVTANVPVRPTVPSTASPTPPAPKVTPAPPAMTTFQKRQYHEAHKAEIVADYEKLGWSATQQKWNFNPGSLRDFLIAAGVTPKQKRDPAPPAVREIVVKPKVVIGQYPPMRCCLCGRTLYNYRKFTVGTRWVTTCYECQDKLESIFASLGIDCEYLAYTGPENKPYSQKQEVKGDGNGT